MTDIVGHSRVQTEHLILESLLMKSAASKAIPLSTLLHRDRYCAKAFFDFCAFAENIPITAISMKKVRGTYRACCDSNTKFRDRFATSSEFSSYLDACFTSPDNGIITVANDLDMWKEVYRTEAIRGRVTWACNSDALFDLLREDLVFAIWENLYWLKVALDALDPEFIGQSCVYEGLFGGRLHSSFAVSGHSEIGIIAGPVWAIEFEHDASADRTAQIYDNYLRLRPNAHTSRSRFGRLSGSRASLSQVDLADRSERIARIVQTFSQLKIPETTFLSTPAAQDLATIGMLLDQQKDRFQNYLKVSTDRAAIFTLRLPLQNEDYSEGQANALLLTITQSASQSADLSFKLDISPTPDRQERLKFSTNEQEPDCAALKRAFGRLTSRITTAANSKLADQFRLLRNQVNDRLGGLIFDGDRSTIEQTFGGIARKVARIFDADSAAVCKYNYRSSGIEVLGSYESGVDDTEYNKLQTRSLQNASGLKDRQRPIAYRAFDKNTVRWVGECDDESEVSANWLSHNVSLTLTGQKAVCAIAAPLRLFGRPWGVLWIKSYTPGRFWIGSPYRLDELCHLLTSYIYQAWLRHSIHRLDSVTANSRDVVHRQYDEVCEISADLMMCEAALLWLRSDDDPTAYECVGASKTCLIQDGDILPKLNLMHPSQSDVSQLLSQWNTNSERDEIRWEPIALKPNSFPVVEEQTDISQHIIDLGFSKGHVLSLRDSADASASQLQGLFILLPAAHTTFDPRWSDYAQLLARFMSVTARVIQEPDQQRTHDALTYAHALKSIGTRIKNQTDVFVRELDLMQVHQKFNVSHDLRKAIEDIEIFVPEMLSFTSLIGKASSPDYRRVAPSADRKYTTEVRTVLLRAVKSVRSDIEGIRGSIALNQAKDVTPRVPIPEGELFEICSNLVDNAAKYSVFGVTTEQGVKCNLESSSSFGLRFTVSNYGYALTPRDEARMFSARYRGKNTAGVDGDGMGLCVVKTLCDRNGLRVSYLQATDPGRRAHDGKKIMKHQFSLHFPERLLWRG